MSIRKVLKSECGPTVEHAAKWLAEETGGAVVVAGKIQDLGDHFVIPVFSADGKSEVRGNGGAAAGRQMFQVIRPGVATDGTKFQGQFTEFKFPTSLQVEDGSLFSAAIPQQDVIDPGSIVVETGSQADCERKEFESFGRVEDRQPLEPGKPVIQGWDPCRGTPDTGLNGGRPHDGRFSHPNLQDRKEK